MSDLLQYIITGVTIGAIYALVALGFHIIFKATEIFNFAQGTFVVFGGLLAYSLVVNAKIHFAIALVLVAAIGLVAGRLLEIIIRKPLLTGAHLIIIIATIAIGIILENAYLLIWSKEYMPFPPFTAGDPVPFLGAIVPRQSLWVIGLTVAVLVLVKLFFKCTLSGRAMEAAANNPMAARSVGIKVELMIIYSLAMSTALAFVGGMMIAPITFAGGPAGPGLTVKGFVAGILGGIEDSNAVILGGLLFGLMESLVGGLISSGLNEAITFSLLLIIFGFRPTGLFVRSKEGL